VAAKISPVEENRTIVVSSGLAVSASYNLGPIGMCDTREEDGAEVGMGGRSMVARYRCGMGEYASERGRDDTKEWRAARFGDSRELVKLSVSEVRVYTELRRSSVPRWLKRSVPSL
jgi:hypothetical protein